jgi:hypothetical protein
MTGFLEFLTPNNGRAWIEAGSISGAVSSSPDPNELSGGNVTVKILLRGGDTVPVIGCSPVDVICRIGAANPTKDIVLYRHDDANKAIDGFLQTLAQRLHERGALPPGFHDDTPV